MSEANFEQRLAQKRERQSAEKSEFWVGVSCGILFLFSAASVFLMLFIVPKFEQIFADALPGMPLPGATEFIISWRLALALAALSWPFIGIAMRKLRKPYAILWINLGIIWCLLQAAGTIIAMFMPMVGIDVGTSNVAAIPR